MAAPLPLPVNPIGVNGYPGGIQMPDIQQVCVYMSILRINKGINGQKAKASRSSLSFIPISLQTGP